MEAARYSDRQKCPAEVEALSVSVERAEQFSFASGEYTDLHGRSDATAFQHPVWLENLYRNLVPHRGAEAVIVTGRRPGGRLMVVLPLIRRTVTGVTLLESADLGVSDYAAPVVDPDIVLTDGLRKAIRQVLPDADFMRIKPVRAEHVERWRALLGGVPLRQDFSAHAVELSGDHAVWQEETFEAGFRKMLNRKEKRFRKQDGAGIRLLTGESEIRAAIQAMARLRAGRFEGDMIQSGAVEQFYADVAAGGVDAGLTRTYEISIAGEAFGYAFGICRNGRFHYLMIGCDYEAHGRHSPGLILYDAMISDWMGNGGTRFDFTIGDEPFKMQFGTAPTPIYAIEDGLTWRGKAAAAALAARSRLRRQNTVRDLIASLAGTRGAS